MTLSAPVLLSAEHVLDDFSCDVASLDEWLKRRAYPNQVSGASRTYVVTEGRKVVGYYCLAFGIRGILVHAISNEAKNFYEHHGFTASPSQPMTLILSLKDGAL